MMRLSRLAPALAGLFLVLQPRFVQATPGGDGISWLQRIARAAQQQNFQGVFVYQSGNMSETSRISHLVDALGERERIEVLDGSPREVVRDKDEIQCFLPDDKRVVVEKRSFRRAFPGLFVTSLGNIGEHYNVRKAEVERIAGHETQAILLAPKDRYRYAHKLWADTATGLLLRARIINAKGEGVEQFSFTQVDIGEAPEPETLRPKYERTSRSWKLESPRAIETRLADRGWHFRASLPGFVKSAEMKRQMRESEPEVEHVVFSDGIAAISVFIEPKRAGQAPKVGLYLQGAIHIYTRVVDGYVVTVLGEVPAVSVRRLGDGIEHD